MFSAYSSGLYDPLSKLWQTAIYYIDIARFVSIFDWGSLVAVPLTIHFGAKQTGLNFRSQQSTKPQGFTYLDCFLSENVLFHSMQPLSKAIKNPEFISGGVKSSENKHYTEQIALIFLFPLAL